jgi:Mn-dependent DtxR family transcriptional regulator
VNRTDLSSFEAEILHALRDEGDATLYDVASTVGTGPREVMEAVQRLSRDGLVDVADRGARLACTRDGDRALREHRP